MGVKTNYFRLGLFVVAAIAAAIASILILLGPSLGKPYAEMETYFQFSISGLEVGAPVKFRGIQVGQVQEILLSTEAYPSSSQEILSETKAVAVVRMRMELAGKEV
ncbi:MlaD family protein, partial [Parasutterella excrementihominis]